jgi:C-terminal processing protease CtpA/Prc
MKAIEENMVKLHTLAKQQPKSEDKKLDLKDEMKGHFAFLTINEVTPESPSHQAGFKPQDAIYKFGSVRKTKQDVTNQDLLKTVAELVRDSEGKSIEVVVQRQDSTFHKLFLIPKKWEGRGLIG